MVFVSLISKDKDVIDYNYQSLMELVMRSKEKEKDENYDAQQAMESLDIDDYEVDDDIDGSTEAFDGYEN